VRAAGVTRGALYHQFTDKTELFAAVYEEIEQELAARLGERIAAEAATDPIEVMTVGADAWLDACVEPEVQQIVLLDGPSVLGWQRGARSGCATDSDLSRACWLRRSPSGGSSRSPSRAWRTSWWGRWTRPRCT